MHDFSLVYGQFLNRLHTIEGLLHANLVNAIHLALVPTARTWTEDESLPGPTLAAFPREERVSLPQAQKTTLFNAAPRV